MDLSLLRRRALRQRATDAETLLWRLLRSRQLHHLKFRRQHPAGPYILDFYCHEARLCVEIDGGGHSFGDRPDKDARRDQWLADKGIRTLRISAALVLDEVDDAVRTIVAFVCGDGQHV